MPAVLDVIGGSAWLRGFLPTLNRFGQSIPPLLVSDGVRRSGLKRTIVVSTTLVMGFAFLLLALIWMVTGGDHSSLPFVFLLIYACFFTATGINQLGLNTLTGKLVKIRQRGLLSLLGTVIGALLAVICAYVLLNFWLSDTEENGGSRFDLIFLFTGVAFCIAALLVSRLRERPDISKKPTLSLAKVLSGSLDRFRDDRNFMLLAIAAGLFGMALTLFPHYQRLGRDRFELGLTALIPWVIAQNLGAASFSIPSGWIADRLGNRIVLRWMLATMCVAPVLAIVLAQFPSLGWSWFTVVFWLLGLTPVAIRFFNNYTLEITERSNHPKYLSTLGLAMALPPMLLSIPIGWLAEAISFEFVFLVVTVCLLTAFILTFFLIEPRHENGKNGTTDGE